LIYYTCDVNICVEMDPGTHMVCARFYPLEPGVTPGDAFDAVGRIKAALEAACPGVVSCADALALAAGDLVAALGGPNSLSRWAVATPTAPTRAMSRATCRKHGTHRRHRAAAAPGCSLSSSPRRAPPAGSLGSPCIYGHGGPSLAPPTATASPAPCSRRPAQHRW
jgi:hypothetical protein